ncbi:lipase [Rhizobium glycinendophyticum]|uniref:Lipase n=1 Tax=Rhizobium glycinendophyticum TaxID=2589807 RepID=A0A504UDX7_9HYPH|nr:lipase [Rhizobium glycinendophyticum]TPP11290.1 lipase [Rhizobium glycinendophyticum]
MTEGSQASVARRAVFLVGGYERNDSAGFFRRIGREMARFSACWGIVARMEEPQQAPDGIAATARVTYQGSDGQCTTDLTFLSFDDLVKRDGARPFAQRLWVYLISFLDYVASGTMFRFFQTNWRFALYFLYPALSLAAFAGIGYLVFRLVSFSGFAGSGILGAFLGLIVAYAVGRSIGRRYFVFHLMDLWSFSREHLRCRRPDMDQRLEAWSRLIETRLKDNPYDEVLLVGHSTGGALILDVAHLLAERLTGEGYPVDFTLLTVGSTSLKVGLHPAAKRARSRLEALASHPGLRWTEFQALTDIINFYKCDPYRLAGLTHQRADAFPRMFQVRFRDMLEKESYQRIKRNFFRVHYQFISANSRRYFYDFFLICCGTRRLKEVRPGNLPETAVEAQRTKVEA